MAHGILTSEQAQALKPIIAGRHVTDLGCGDMVLSVQLATLGARVVLAIDKEFPHRVLKTDRVVFQRQDFFDMSDVEDIAFVSWPSNRVSKGLTALVLNAKTVIYLGKNTDGNSCGSHDLFRAMLLRDVSLHVPDMTNTLIVTERRELEKAPRFPLAEEFAALHGQSADREPFRYSE
jgi:hypothetical protein